jgi:hypothetical protein
MVAAGSFSVVAVAVTTVVPGGSVMVIDPPRARQVAVRMVNTPATRRYLSLIAWGASLRCFTQVSIV